MRTHIVVVMASAFAVACGQHASSAALCTPDNCSGCCSPEGECHAGIYSPNCGAHGDACVTCAAGQICSLAVCITGTPAGGGSAAGGGGGHSGGGGTDGGGFGGAGGGGFGATGGGLGGGGGIGLMPHNDAGYPAPHPAFPTEVNLGGPVLQTPRVMSITFANDVPGLVSAIDDFTATVGNIDYWSTTTREYGVGALAVAAPVHLNESPSGLIEDADIQTWLGSHLTGPNPALGAPDLDTVYMIYYPTGVTIDAGGLSCASFGAYHATASVNGDAIVYAVIPRCTGFVPGANDADNITAIASHELIEAVTDPITIFPAWGAVDEDHEAWNMTLYGEVGDLCAFDTDAFFKPPGYSHMVQRIWSNAVAADGGYPCVPNGGSVASFGAVPVLNDAVPFDYLPWSVSGHTLGAHIPLGSSQTVDVVLYGAEPGQYIDVTAMPYPATNTLEFTFPQGSTGFNGDVVQMEVRHLADDPQLGGATFFVAAGIGGVTHFYMGFIGD